MSHPTSEDTPAAAIAHQLMAAPIFSSLELQDLEALAAGVEVAVAADGEAIVKQGDPGDSLFVILEGEVRVRQSAGDAERDLASLHAGDIFGELALVTGEPRNATVTASGRVRYGRLGEAALAAVIRRRPEIDDEMRRIASARLRAAPRVGRGQALANLTSATNIAIGSQADADVIVAAPGVGARHAVVAAGSGAWTLTDLGSDAGTLVNRQPVEEVPLAEGDVIRVGAARLLVADGVLYAAVSGGGVSVEAHGVTVRVGERALLDDVSLVFEPGDFVAIVGPSGAGKSTLLNALLGLRGLDGGTVSFDGTPLAADPGRVRSLLGYVPQYDIVHQELTVRESLTYTAALRLPPGTPPGEVDERIAALLHQLHLDSQADLLVSRLSGGQRKRASIAAELLTNPGVVFLDEPTSGLDPLLDSALMLQMRELADEGRTIVITTHATRNIQLCDRVVVVNRGRVVFDGTPTEAMSHFGVADFAEVYAGIGDPESGVAEFRATRAYRRQQALLNAVREPRPAAEMVEVGARPGPIRQLAPLARRNTRILTRDRLNLALRVFGAPALAALLLGSFESDIFALTRADGGNAQQSVILLYLAASIMLFLGAFTSANAITGEAGVFRRERLVGLSPFAYVLAKVGVAVVFCIAQGVLFVGVLAISIEFPAPAGETVLQLMAVLALVSSAGMALGMVISSVSANPDRAAILVVLALIPQLVFAGATIPRSEMGPVSKAISEVTVTKRALELGGSITGLEERFAAQSVQQTEVDGATVEVRSDYRPFEGAFDVSEPVRWFVLSGFVVLFIGLTVFVQYRRSS